MTRHVPISEFKDHASEFVAAAERGEEIVITRHGKPVAALQSAGAMDDNRKSRTLTALTRLSRLREEAAAKGMTATAEEWIAWKNEGHK